MTVDLNRLPSCLAWGAFWGAAAWSAYAVVEFVFSSVVFQITRPYAVFPGWHWRLTGILVLAYVLIGPVLGAIGGALAWLLRNRMDEEESDAVRVLECAGTLPLAVAVMVNGIVILWTGLGFSGIWQVLAAAV